LNIRKLIIIVISIVGFMLTKTQAQPQSLSLFNGTDLTGWHSDVPDMDRDATLISPFIAYLSNN
jgi:hypothetical protein